MGTYDSIATGIITILNTVSELKAVYDGEKKALANFPAATLSASSHTNEYQSLNSNKRKFNFIIRFYFRTDDANNADYEVVLRKVVDASLYALEHDVTLGGVCDFSLPTSARWSFGEKESPVRICELNIECIVHKIR